VRWTSIACSRFMAGKRHLGADAGVCAAYSRIARHPPCPAWTAPAVHASSARPAAVLQVTRHSPCAARRPPPARCSAVPCASAAGRQTTLISCPLHERDCQTSSAQSQHPDHRRGADHDGYGFVGDSAAPARPRDDGFGFGWGVALSGRVGCDDGGDDAAERHAHDCPLHCRARILRHGITWDLDDAFRAGLPRALGGFWHSRVSGEPDCQQPASASRGASLRAGGSADRSGCLPVHTAETGMPSSLSQPAVVPVGALTCRLPPPLGNGHPSARRDSAV
jgi:hypothetical protein